MANPLDLEAELIPFASPEERQLLGSRALSADDEQAMLAEIRSRLTTWRASLKPTRAQLLQATHEENRMHARLDGGNQQFWDALDADWRRKQKPNSPQWNAPTREVEDPRSSTRPSMDSFWQPIDKINDAAANKSFEGRFRDIPPHELDSMRLPGAKPEIDSSTATQATSNSATTRSQRDKIVAFLESSLFLGGVGVVVAILALVYWG